MESIAQSSDNHNYRAIVKVIVLESLHRRDSEMCFVSYGATTAGFLFPFSPHFMSRIASNRSEIVNPSFAPLFLESCDLVFLTSRMSGEEDETQVLLKERGATQRSLQMADSFLE